MTIDFEKIKCFIEIIQTINNNLKTNQWEKDKTVLCSFLNGKYPK